jgi:hypothetical protein
MTKFMIPIWILISLASISIVSGSRVLTDWSTLTVSNKSFLFFFNLMAIGAIGGILSSKVHTLPLKLIILLITYLLVFIVGFIMSKSLPIRF